MIPNVPGPTLGGLQWWTDRRVTCGGWRVQRHAVTGHHRLLNPEGFRHTAGTFERCCGGLEMRCGPFAAKASQAVILLHGLGRTRHAMNAMQAHLISEGFDVYNVGYASTRANIDAHAAALFDVVQALPRYEAIHTVGHSLGNLLVRRFFKQYNTAGRSWGTAVMLAPPNMGSKLATTIDGVPIAGPVLRRLLGTSAIAIATWQQLSTELASSAEIPAKVGVIAASFRRIVNPVIGDGDLVVGVEETRLEGADHLIVAGSHTLLMRDPLVLRATTRFIRTGTFEQQATH